ncbi:MAG: MBL fold metallo-hydrolase [Dehalococcoidia bacterium]|tara:strand:- start:83 stop:730 length:648 start_codon:yes stop_codon:yes gene_type:complete
MNIYQDENIHATITQIDMGPYSNNGYLIKCNQTNEGIIIDTPAEPEKIIEEIGDTNIVAILITHGHQDHLLGFDEIMNAAKCPVYCHDGDSDLLPSSPDVLIQDNQRIPFGNQEIICLFTPGHTNGSTCYLLGNHLFSGDTLFPGGPGKSKNPEAFTQEIHSIESKLLVLPPEVDVYPGHGDTNTTIEEALEKFSVFTSKPHAPDLCGDVDWLNS